MNKQIDEIDVYLHESRLEAAKEISYSHLSKDELINRYSIIVNGYEALIREVKNQTLTAPPPGIPDSPARQPDKQREMKRRLLSHVTHEFLTLLNLIITPIEQMLLNCQNPEQKEMLSMVYRNGRRLLRSVNQVLEKEEQEKDRKQNRSLPAVEKDEQNQDVVLVVEDSKDMRNFIKTMLTEAGFMVVEADDGRQGIDVAKKIVPDIIISDIIMPNVDGIELCRVLKKNIDTSHIPIILLTARAAEKDVIRGMEAYADDYIIKPFNIEVLLARIKNLIKLRRQLQEKLERRMRLQPEEISLSELEKRFLDKIQELIEDNLSDPDFGADQLAAALDISRPTLYRKIMALTGFPPNKFIQAYRLKRSVDLLNTHCGNITEVAYKVGFSNSAYFTKCFKEAFSRLPSDFKPF
jgi:DNA-binding response OmpR family regulator